MAPANGRNPSLAITFLKWFFHSKTMVIGTIILITLICSYRMLSSEYSGQPELWSAPTSNMQWLAQDKFDHNRIAVSVGTSSDAGNRIGDIIAMRVEFVTDRDVELDLSAALDGYLEADNSGYYYNTSPPAPDFEVVQTPTLTKLNRNGRTVYQVNLLVRSWKVASTLKFTFKFQYSNTIAGNQYWIERNIPTATLETSRSAQPEDQFDTGDKATKNFAASPLADPLQWLGLGILTALIIWLTIGLLLAMRKPPRQPSAQEKAWATFDDVSRHAGDRWTQAHYLAIATALRRYLSIEHPGLETETLEQLAQRHDLKDQQIILSVFKMLDGALYAEQTLSQSERMQLFTMLEALVPRDSSAPVLNNYRKTGCS